MRVWTLSHPAQPIRPMSVMRNGRLLHLTSPCCLKTRCNGATRCAKSLTRCAGWRLFRAGAPWRLLPTNFLPWPIVYQQTQRWIRAGCFAALVADLRLLLRLLAGHSGQPSAMILDSRTVQSTPESGGRAGYDGYKRRKCSKVPKNSMPPSTPWATYSRWW